MKRDFQTELREARPKAVRLVAYLAALGIEHKPIDVEQAGILALVETPSGEYLGDIKSLGDKSKDDLLCIVRFTLATSVARRKLGIEQNGHFIHIQEVIIPQSVANWLVEIWFDEDESRYAVIGEYIATDPGRRRFYSAYQVKKDRFCDVSKCHARWHERKTSTGGYVVHVCRKHQTLDADTLYGDIHHQEA